MPDSQSLSLFKCSSCGAPLDPAPGMATMKCPYCGATVIIPETLRASASSPSQTGKSGGYTSLSDVTELAKQGKFDEAARIYSKITGLKHEYALLSVKSMAGVRDDEPAQSVPPPSRNPTYSTGPVIVNRPQTGSRPGEPFVVDSLPSTLRARPRNRSCLGGLINLIVLIFILVSVFPSILEALPFEFPSEIPGLPSGDSLIAAPFADQVFAFSPQGMNDPRAIGVDGNGNIVVGDFSSDEIRVFDSAGNLIVNFTPEGDPYLTTIAVTRDGVIYVPGDTIQMYDLNGQKLGGVGEPIFFGYKHIALGPNDTVHAMTHDAIVRFDQNGRIDLSIPVESLEELSGETIGTGQIAVDAQGNIYFWGNFDATIYKFSPQGRYLIQFGGEEGNDGFEPGKFVSPHQIAFDNFGRLYVVDFFNIQVLDAGGNYIDRIESGHYGAAFDSQNNLYATTAVDHSIVKYEVKSPGDQ